MIGTMFTWPALVWTVTAAVGFGVTTANAVDAYQDLRAVRLLARSHGSGVKFGGPRHLTARFSVFGQITLALIEALFLFAGIAAIGQFRFLGELLTYALIAGGGLIAVHSIMARRARHKILDALRKRGIQ